MSRRARVCLLPVALAWACADEPSATDEGAEDPPPPPKIELMPLELEVSATAVGGITLAVVDVLPDAQVEIDGRRWHPGSRAPALLAGGELHLPLGGSMVVGTHELTLVQSSGSSETVTISIVEAELGSPSAMLEDTVVELGDALLVHGQGPDTSLALLDLPSERALVWAGQWAAEPFTLELPGIGATAQGADLAIIELPDTRAVLLAWMLADASAVRARVMPVDIHGAPTGDAGEVLEVWRLDDPDALALLGTPELARIDALALLERTITIAVEARRDAEQTHVGDRVLITRYLSAELGLGEALLLRGGLGQDLDLPSDARLWTPKGYDSALAVRVGLGFPWLLTLGSNGLPGLEDDPGSNAALSSEHDFLSSADAAFGSRHAFALDTTASSPRVQVLRVNRWSTPDPELEPLEWVELPAQPHGLPRLATFDGIASLVIPMGSDADVLVLQSTGAHTQVLEVPGLRCDELALAGPGFDGIADALPLVCLRERELRPGFMRGK